MYEKYRNHDITKNTFTEDMWWFFYYIGKEMYENGVRTFDDTTTYSFLASRPTEVGRKSYFDHYNQHGGYNSIEEVKEECQKDKGNEDYHFSEVQKYESLRMFQLESLINTNDKSLVMKLTKMTLKQLQSFFQYKTNKIFSHVNSGEVVEYNLGDDLNIAIDKMNAGEAMGIPLHEAPRLTKMIKGWRKGELIYLVLSSGMGKSSMAMAQWVLSLYNNGEKGLMYANEENIWKTRNLLLASVASNILHKPINREKMADGNFDEKTMEKLIEAKEWIEQFNKEHVKFFDLKKYRMEDVINRINLMKPLNYNYAILDTMKPETSNAEAARWEAFSNAAQDLFNTIKPEANNVGMLATVQMKIGKEFRYMDLSVIGKSLEIVEVAAVVLIGRLLYEDEVNPDSKNRIFAYNWIRDEFMPDKWFKKEYKLDPEKTYMLLQAAKNRNGETTQQIIYEANYGINQFKEVAYCQLGRRSNTVF